MSRNSYNKRKNNNNFNKDKEFNRESSREIDSNVKDGRKGTNPKGQRKARSRGFHDSDGNSKPTGNHDSWWCKNDQLTKDAGSFSFEQPVGARMPGFEYGEEFFTPAGIMVLRYAPCLGTIKGSSDPINVAARLLYDVINAKNSRNSSYDPSDLMTYVIAVANAWALHTWMVRAIGLMLTYSPKNRYIPDALLHAMGMEPSNVQNDITKWRNVANWLAVKLNQMPVPKGIDYFDRAEFMCKNVYIDDPGDKPSIFFFQPEGFLCLKEPDDKHDQAWLKIEKVTGTGKNGLITPDDLELFANTMIKPILNSTDFVNMSTDIIKAFGLENCYSKGMVNESYVTIPTYDPDIMPQIHNARTFAPTSQFYDKYTITQNMKENCLVATMPCTYSANSIIWSFLKNNAQPLDMPYTNPTATQVMKATRLMWAISDDKLVIDPVCIEILTYIDIWKFKDDGTGTWVLDSYTTTTDVSISPNTTWEVMATISDYNKFLSAPMLHVHYFSDSTSDPADYVGSKMISDVQNYTVLSKYELHVLHTNGLLSIFSPFGSAGK